MKKTSWMLLLLLFFAVTIASASDQADMKAMKQKLSQKIEAMKAEGASQQEIDKMVTEFKKKVAAMETGQKSPPSKVDQLKVEAKKKIAAMKAEGASGAEIKEITAKYKQKIKQLEAKAAKEEKSKSKVKSKKTKET